MRPCFRGRSPGSLLLLHPDGYRTVASQLPAGVGAAAMRRQPGTAEVPCFTFQLSKGLGIMLLRFSPAFPFSVVEGYSQVVAPRHSAATLGHLFLQDGVVSPIPTSSLSTTSYWVFEAVLRGGRSPIRNPGDALDGLRRTKHTRHSALPNLHLKL